MYRTNEIKAGLLHLIGWRQNYNPADLEVSSSLTQTETGQYFQDIHPLLTLDNIKAIAPDFKNIVLPTWNETDQYRTGARVDRNGTQYRANIPNTDKYPETSANEWEFFDPFNEWLEMKTGASILNAISVFFSDKMIDSTAKSILENKILFDGSGRLTDLVYNYGSLVGFEIIPIRAKGILLRIESIGLQFKGTGTIKLYLFHSSNPTPIQTINLVRTKDGGMDWFTQDNLILPYVSADIDAGGSWFLCYDQREQGAQQAIYRSRDWSKRPCDTCNREEYQSWQIWSKFLEIHPFRQKTKNPGDMPTVGRNVYTYDSNYGINLQVSMECDLTDIIIEQRALFQNVIGLQVASDFIREMAYNPNFRLNRLNQNFSKMELLYELDGDSQSPKKAGINYKLSRAMTALKIDTTGINRVCLPCTSNGIRYRTV